MFCKILKTMVLLLFAILMVFPAAGCGDQSAGGDNQNARAADYPTKPVTLIVAYGAGGGTDVTARLLAEPLQKELGQPVSVINVTGGGGWNGWGQLAHSDTDGYTIGYINVPNMFTGYLDPQLQRQESLESFEPIMNHITDPCVWAVRSDSEFENVQDVIGYLEEHPGDLTIAAHGYGGDDHLGILQIQKQTGVEFSIIHNEGTGDSISQLLGGHIDILGANVGEVTQMAQKGEVKLLGVMSEQGSPFLPGVPTFKEQGYNALSFAGRGIAAPAGTPRELVDAIAAALENAFADPDHLARCEELGLELDVKKDTDYQKFLKDNEQMVKELMGW